MITAGFDTLVLEMRAGTNPWPTLRRRAAMSQKAFATPQAIEVWNQAEGKAIGMFHVTC